MGWSCVACRTGGGSIRGKATWRDRRGRAARWPDLEDLTRQRTTRIVLAAAHVNHDPTRSGQRNLRAWCQACHLAHDRAWHLLQRWITFRLRYARGDLFLGPYQHGPSAAILLAEILARISDRLSDKREPEPPPRLRPRGLGRGSARVRIAQGAVREFLTRPTRA